MESVMEKPVPSEHPSNEAMLRYLKANEHTYLFDSDTYGKPLRPKTLTPVAGPSGSGKTTVSDYIVDHNEWFGFGPIGTTGTRDGRDNDPAVYKMGTPLSTIYDAVKSRSIVNYTVYADNVYGTMPEDFHGRHSIGPVVTNNLEALMDAGFRDTFPVFLVEEYDVLYGRLVNSRLGFGNIRGRFEADRESIEFARQNLKEGWLHMVEVGNGKKALKKTAREIVRLTTQKTPPLMDLDRADHLLIQMRRAIDDAENLL